MDDIKEKPYPATINILTSKIDLEFLSKKCKSDSFSCQFLVGCGCRRFEGLVYGSGKENYYRCAECLEKYPPLVKCPNQDAYGHMPTCHICNGWGWVKESELEDKQKQLNEEKNG